MKVYVCLVALIISQAVASAQNPPKTMDEVHRLHQDSKAYIAMLDDPARDAHLKPHEVVMSLGLEEGETIADIGAGSRGTSLFVFPTTWAKTAGCMRWISIRT